MAQRGRDTEKKSFAPLLLCVSALKKAYSKSNMHNANQGKARYKIVHARDQPVLWDCHSDVLQRTQSPHFHAKYGEDEDVIDIATLTLMHGFLPRRALELRWTGQSCIAQS